MGESLTECLRVRELVHLGAPSLALASTSSQVAAVGGFLAPSPPGKELRRERKKQNPLEAAQMMEGL